MQQGEIRRCRSVKQEQSYRGKRALQNMIAWQSSKAAFAVDISKDLQINQITTPAEIFHLDFQQERECVMLLTCVGLPK